MKNKTLIVWAILMTALTIGTFLFSFGDLHGGMMIGMERYKTAALAIGPVVGVIVIVSGIAVAFMGVVGATAGLSAVVALGIMAVIFTAFAGFMGGFAFAVVIIIGWVGYCLIKSTITNDENKSLIILFNIMEIIVIAAILGAIIFNY